MSDRLKVLLADTDLDRALLIEAQLRELGDIEIARIPVGSSLLDAVRAAVPDVLIVDMARPDRDGLDDLRRVSRDNPRPIVMFVEHDDRGFMEEAIAAGVCSYNVVGAAFPDVKPILMAALAIFNKHRLVESDLEKARAALLERDNIARAKAMLMRQRKLDEPQAYGWLRRKAMNENKRLAAVAAELLAGSVSATSKEGEE